MPKSVGINEVAPVVLAYIIKRQQQGRPTSLRQVSKRVSLGMPTIRTCLDREKTLYYEIAYGGHILSHEIEIAVRSISERMASAIGVSVAEVEESYRRIFGEGEPDIVRTVESPIKVSNKPSLVTLKAEVVGDPYAPFRIEREEYRRIKKNLISYASLIQEARLQGVPGSAVMRAVGGDRLRYSPVSPAWRPYIYRNHRYYARDVLKRLDEVFLTYKHRNYGERKRREAKEMRQEKREREPV